MRRDRCDVDDIIFHSLSAMAYERVDEFQSQIMMISESETNGYH